MTNDDDEFKLNSSTAAILAQFLIDKESENLRFDQLKQESEKRHLLTMVDFKEDWQLSQFWYTAETSELIAAEALEQTHSNGRIGCIASPSAFVSLQKMGQNRELFLFEIDTRFDVFQNEFVCYDFNKPLDFPDELRKSFDYLIIDPPFLSQECWKKTSFTAKQLIKQGGKILVCTGMVMKQTVLAELNCRVVDFEPQHQNGLSNEFGCFINYKSAKFSMKSP
jgi:16S rRNA G966 N2-methylase RsmD